MAKFQWENLEQFIGLVNLLSLRNDGRIQPGNGKEEEHEDIDVCGDDQAAWDGKEKELKQHFLDRFAELMSRDKGGKYVCCAALRQSASRHPGEGVKTSLLVARNHGFQKRDSVFCGKLERLLADINGAETNSIRGVKCTVILEELVCYNQPRLNRLRRHLRAFKASGSLDSIPPYGTFKLPQDNGSEGSTFCDDQHIGPYSEATHEVHMKLVQERIRGLDNILCANDCAAQRRCVIEYAYFIRQMKTLEIFLHSRPKDSVGRRLFLDIHSWGRLKSCYHMLVNATLNIPGFAQLSIVLVKNLPPRVCPSTLPPLTDVMKFLGRTLNPLFVKKFINRKSSVDSTQRSFEQLQKKISGKKVLYTHAELQLILYITTMTDIKVTKEICPYIGCSKLSCFLCAAFLNSFRHRGITFRTRGGHGMIYTRWSIPDVDGVHDDTVAALHSAVKTMRKSLVHEMFKPLTSTVYAPKLSAGFTVQDTQSSFTHQHHKYLAAQCQVDSSSTNASENPASSDLVGGLGTCNVDRAFEPAEISKVCGEVMPGHVRGECHVRFRGNWGVPNSQHELHFLAVARSYLDPEDRKKELRHLVPEAKRKSFVLYAMLLNGNDPKPCQFDAVCKDLYFQFGFVTGRGSEGEQVLPKVYRSLISNCSFTEFWTAFESKNLITLMDAKGLKGERSKVGHLEVFLKIKRDDWCPTVWHLRLFVRSPDIDPPPQVTADYGFFNCKTVEEKNSLKEIYRRLLQSPMVDPMDLHAACVKGKLCDFARQHEPLLEQKFERLMTNIYTITSDIKGAGAGAVDKVEPPSFLLFLALLFLALSFISLSG